MVHFWISTIFHHAYHLVPVLRRTLTEQEKNLLVRLLDAHTSSIQIRSARKNNSFSIWKELFGDSKNEKMFQVTGLWAQCDLSFSFPFRFVPRRPKTHIFRHSQCRNQTVTHRDLGLRGLLLSRKYFSGPLQTS